MITKERLEELIKQEATIYGVFIYGISDLAKVIPYKLNNLFYIEETDGQESLMINFVSENSDIRPGFINYLQNLYETEEQAEWALKYHATRTEELDLPTWEEAQKGIEYNIYAPKGCIYRLKTKIKTGYSCDKENPYIIRIEKVGFANSQHDFEFNEENYIKACDLCLKLFKGEENGN